MPTTIGTVRPAMRPRNRTLPRTHGSAAYDADMGGRSVTGQATALPAVVAARSRPPGPYRVLLVDDLPEIRMVLRARLSSLIDLEVIGEASNGKEGVALVWALAPDLVILDLEMPVMTGEEAIPLMRAIEPGMPILLFTATSASAAVFAAEAAPDAVVRKGQPLGQLVATVRDLLGRGSFDVVRLDLGTVPLHHAVAAFDAWVGVNVRILQALSEGRELAVGPDSPTADQLVALIGLFVHLGSCLRMAALADLDEVELVVHTLRAAGAEARRGLIAIRSQGMSEFLASWDYETSADANEALDIVWDRLLAALPVS